MKARIKQPGKLQTLLKELKERRIIVILFLYAIGAFGFIANLDQITPDERIKDVAWIICLTGVPIVAVASWFHGKGGRNPIPAIEVILISICFLTGGGFAVRTLVKPTPLTILIRMMDPQESWFKENQAATIPYYETTAVVHVPFGAHPTCCYLYYTYDKEFLDEYIGYARRGKDGMDEWLDKYVYDVSREEYIEKIGGEEKLKKLRNWRQKLFDAKDYKKKLRSEWVV